MSDKPIAKRAKKKKKRKKDSAKSRGARNRVLLTPMELAARRVKDNKDFVFATEYLRTMDVVKAAVAVGINADADVLIWKMFRSPGVQKIIQEEFDKRTDASGITKERIINEIAAIAFANELDYAAWNGHDVAAINSGTLTREQGAAVSVVSSRASSTGVMNVSVKMHDKNKALELLAKIKGMLSVDGKGDISSKDVKPLAERLMQEVGDMQAATAPGKDDEDGERDEGS